MKARDRSITNVIAITGATGFIGRHLIEALSKFERVQIRILSRTDTSRPDQSANLRVVTGNLGDMASLFRLVTPGCTLINLAYSHNSTGEQNVAYARTLAKVCSKVGPKQVLHCSTVSVFGRIGYNVIDERMLCSPSDEYSRAKLEIEEIFRESSSSGFRLFTLRPTAVLGKGGLTLSKLIDEILCDAPIKNYIRQSVYGNRRLNLVGVSTLVDAMLFLMGSDETKCGEYIVSQDDVEENNYKYFSDLVYNEIGVKRTVPRLYLPRQFLEALLRVRGRSVVDASRYYSSSKLRDAGFIFKEDFCSMLRAYISDYISFSTGQNRREQNSAAS